ncbi:unnamed protein product [Boreogadus saida]
MGRRSLHSPTARLSGSELRRVPTQSIVQLTSPRLIPALWERRLDHRTRPNDNRSGRNSLCRHGRVYFTSAESSKLARSALTQEVEKNEESSLQTTTTEAADPASKTPRMTAEPNTSSYFKGLYEEFLQEHAAEQGGASSTVTQVKNISEPLQQLSQLGPLLSRNRRLLQGDRTCSSRRHSWIIVDDTSWHQNVSLFDWVKLTQV